jgi:hypothetical protein
MNTLKKLDIRLWIGFIQLKTGIGESHWRTMQANKEITDSQKKPEFFHRLVVSQQ